MGRWDLEQHVYTPLTKPLGHRAAYLDLLRPSYRSGWGGPLNGQQQRRQIIRDLARAIPFDRVLETGTHRGTTTEFFAAVFSCPVVTVEANRRYYTYCQHRLRHLAPQVRVELGDSREFLRAKRSDETVLIYLDAHWEGDLPLSEELRIVVDSWSRAVVMVDDFKVPGDAGYTFDDYGPGKALTEDLLPPMPGWRTFYPAVPSERETGARRGCLVLASPQLADAANVPTLRPGRVL